MEREDCGIVIDLHLRIHNLIRVRWDLPGKRLQEGAKCLEAIYPRLRTRIEVEPGNIVRTDLNVPVCIAVRPFVQRTAFESDDFLLGVLMDGPRLSSSKHG